MVNVSAISRLSVIALAAAGLLAISSPSSALASTQVPSKPFPLTPSWAFTLTFQHASSPEKSFSSRAPIAAAVPATSTVISIDYLDASFQGASLTWYVNGIVSCNGYPNYLAPSMPSGWDNVISSYQDYANCSFNPHYEDNNYGKSNSNCSSSCSYIGNAMNDQTSSERWGS
jgi:hypothetical protein